MTLPYLLVRILFPVTWKINVGLRAYRTEKCQLAWTGMPVLMTESEPFSVSHVPPLPANPQEVGIPILAENKYGGLSVRVMWSWEENATIQGLCEDRQTKSVA
jgi:hypothetical protein